MAVKGRGIFDNGHIVAVSGLFAVSSVDALPIQCVELPVQLKGSARENMKEIKGAFNSTDPFHGRFPNQPECPFKGTVHKTVIPGTNEDC